MTFLYRPPEGEHQAAQEQVRQARDNLCGARERAAEGRGGAHEVSLAEYALDTALQALARVQQATAEDAT